MTALLASVTMWFIPVMTIVVIAWDIYAFFHGGSKATISHVFQTWGAKFQVIPFATGVIASHLFWPAMSQVPVWWAPLIVLSVFCIGFVVMNLLGYHIPMSAALLLGLAIGRIVWPQPFPGLFP